jgi:hypothetical protein
LCQTTVFRPAFYPTSHFRILSPSGQPNDYNQHYQDGLLLQEYMSRTYTQYIQEALVYVLTG